MPRCRPGNTGALMAMAALRAEDAARHLDRPAIAAMLADAARARACVLDVGATIGADAAPARRVRRDGRGAWRAA